MISVISRDEGGFKGPALLQNILESGLRFGEMDIFHRHESMAGHGEVLFSMANAVKPGVFDLDDIDHFSTPCGELLPWPAGPASSEAGLRRDGRRGAQTGPRTQRRAQGRPAQRADAPRPSSTTASASIEFERCALTQKR